MLSVAGVVDVQHFQDGLFFYPLLAEQVLQLGNVIVLQGQF